MILSNLKNQLTSQKIKYRIIYNSRKIKINKYFTQKKILQYTLILLIKNNNYIKI